MVLELGAGGRATRPSRPASPPGRSTRPQPPANSVSPLNRRPSSSASRQTEPSVWPGRVEDAQADLAEPDLAALGQLDRRHGRRDLERRAERLRDRSSRSRSSGWTAISAPVCAATAALSPMWSQWPWVETISLSVQSRAASSSAIQASDGIAVSIAIASRDPRVGEDVDVGRDRPDDPAEALHQRGRRARQAASRASRACSRRSGRSSCWPCPRSAARRRSASVPAIVDVGGPVHRSSRRPSPSRGPSRASRRPRCPGAWPWALITAWSGGVQLGDLHVDVEPGADEADADLGRRLEVGVVDDLDRSRRPGRTGRPGSGR